uniref:Uncharacterized protein n=1 Tax=Pararge aegeria TaxID=116150 RepID=S4PTA6_9NEOP
MINIRLNFKFFNITTEQVFSMQSAMSTRQEELSELRSYIKDVDIEVTMILQSLQWDRKILLQVCLLSAFPLSQ